MAPSVSVAMSADLLLACYLANATCAITNIMTTLIFIIVSQLHAFFLVVPVRSSLHVIVVVAVISYFQHMEDQPGFEREVPNLEQFPWIFANQSSVCWRFRQSGPSKKECKI